jgi:succinoglycan biosynthesis protein ExoA
MKDLPTIAFVVATLDEEQSIEECVHSLLDQDYPPEKIEVCVVDGGSRDRTRSIVAGLATADPRVHLHHNPRRIAGAAFNIGVETTRGELVGLVSAHSRTDSGFAAVLAEAFRTSGAALVGGRKVAEPVRPASSTATAIARATSSPLGLGSARYHYSEKPGWVDTAFPGAYRRELFSEIGGFDESLVRNQDDELHLRARLAGHAMWFDPRLRSSYQPRRTLRALYRQYYEYGWWRTATIVKHRRIASLRHLAPAALVAGLAAGPGVLIAGSRARLLSRAWPAGVAAWISLLAVAGWRERDAGGGVSVRVAAAVACVHLAYGIGMWRGAVDRVRPAGPTVRTPHGRAR